MTQHWLLRHGTRKVTLRILLFVPPVLLLDLIFIRTFGLRAKLRLQLDELVPDNWAWAQPDAWRSCGGGDKQCCKQKGGPSWATHEVVSARFTPFFEDHYMSVYMMNDIVSSTIQKDHRWDLEKTKQLRVQLHNLGPGAVLLDIGANIGWFSLVAAYSGYRVIAVEPFAGNVAHFRHSLCLAPREVRDRITLLHCGLGLRDGDVCELWHDAGRNRGNFNTVCNDKQQRGKRRRKRGSAHLFKLDSLVASGNISLASTDKVVVKIDTEGFEPFAFLGGKEFLRSVRPAVIYSEYSPEMIRAAAIAMRWSPENSAKLPADFLKFMIDMGYSISKPNETIEIQDLVFTTQQVSA